MKFQKWFLLDLNSGHLEIANSSSVFKIYGGKIASHVKKCTSLFKFYV